jgi:Ca2+-transporting ATPase
MSATLAALLDITRDAGVLAAVALGVHGLAAARYGAGAKATTLAFSTLTTAQLLHALTYRSGSRGMSAGGQSYVGTVVGATVGAQIAAMALPPLRTLLGLTPLTIAEWTIVAGSAALPLLLKQIGPRNAADRTLVTTATNSGEAHGTASANGTKPDRPTRTS